MYKIRVELWREDLPEDGFEVEIEGGELALSFLNSFRKQIGLTGREILDIKRKGKIDYEAAWNEMKKEVRRHLGAGRIAALKIMNEIESKLK
jgi:hypothetical protein